MKTNILSHDLFTLDTYQTFDMDHWYDIHCENIKESWENPDDFDFDFDSTNYLKALAENATDFYNKECIDDIIKSYKLKPDSIYRPAYYNYTTDSAEYTLDFDARKLNAYIKQNNHEYIESCERKSYYIPPLEDYEEKLAFYFKKVHSHKFDDYIMDQFENVPDYDYITYSNR